MNSQLALNMSATSETTTKTPSTRSRSFSNPKTPSPEYVDIGPYTGKRPEVNLTVGSGKSQCGRCGIAFTSVSGFDKHQRLAKDGSIICLGPATVGLVERDGWWSFPPDPRYAKDGEG